MQYCDLKDLDRFLPKKVKIGDDDGDDVTTAMALECIVDASSNIDSDLSTLYRVPLHQIVYGGKKQYPEPIGNIAARIAVALILDRLFAGEQSPEQSKYGEKLNSEASRDIERIKAGQIRLLGQELKGRRFVNHALYNAPKTPYDEKVDTNK